VNGWERLGGWVVKFLETETSSSSMKQTTSCIFSKRSLSELQSKLYMSRFTLIMSDYE
jgi:hypothetical protein